MSIKKLHKRPVQNSKFVFNFKFIDRDVRFKKKTFLLSLKKKMLKFLKKFLIRIKFNKYLKLYL